jgi:hypothetical protein
VTPGAGGDGIVRRFWSASQQPSPPLTRTRKRVALAIAASADALQLVLAPLFGEGFLSPLDDALDMGVALALVGVLGFRPRLLLALAAELVPGISLFPTWTGVVLTLPTDPVDCAPGDLPSR